MLTIESLKEYGADTDNGVARCINNADFYIRMVKTAISEDSVAKLEDALGRGDLAAAFDAAHSMKGVYSNLALTPLLKPVQEITELLRARTDTDYSALTAQLRAEFDKLRALAEEA